MNEVGVAMHQNREEGDGGAAHQTPRGTPPVHDHPGNLPRPTTGACISVYNLRNSDGVSWKTPWRCQYGVDRLSEPTTLVPDISSDNQVVVADGGRII